MTTQATFSHRLEVLLSVAVNPATGRPYTQRQVVEGLQEIGATVSVAYFSQLKSGARDRPNYQLVTALAKFFGVTERFFDLTDNQTWRDTITELEVLTAARDSSVKQVMNRAYAYPDGPMNWFKEVLDQISKTEGEGGDISTQQASPRQPE